MRRIGVLSPFAETDANAQQGVRIFREALAGLGWKEGRDLHFDVRWAAGDANRLGQLARELVATAPNLLFATNSVQTVRALADETKSITIVFGSASDPVDAGLVASLAKPGGNITGFTSMQAATDAKKLELLKELAPRLARALVLVSTADPSNLRRFQPIKDSGPAVGMTVTHADVRSAEDIVHAIEAFAAEPDGGLIVLPNPVATTNREVIIAEAARHRLPAIYPFRYFVASGGLVSYGQDQFEQFRAAAGYAHRILRGEKPGELPIQTPTRFELVVNLKTAQASGIAIPQLVLSRADEIIE